MSREFKNKLLIFCVLIITIFLISLGIWQFKRYKEKERFITAIKYSLNNEPKFISGNIDFQLLLYNKVKVAGNFLTGHDIYLYGRTRNKVSGYYLISPFVTNSHQTILVARGWFMYQNKQNLLNMVHINQKEITGILLPSESKRLFVPKNDFKNNVWFTLDIKEVSNFLNIDLENFYLIQIYNNNIPQYLEPIDTHNLLHIRNNHLEYAITWFSLSIALIIMYTIYVRSIISRAID